MARENYRSLYTDLTKVKDQAGVQESATTYDDALWKLMLAVSEHVEAICGRRFDVITTTKYLDVLNPAEIEVPDLIAVTTLKDDANQDLTFENTWATTDYWLHPFNAEPTKHWGRAYTKIRLRPQGTKTTLPLGERTIEIVGKWGYREFTEASGSLVTDAGGISATVVTVNVTAGTDFAIGQTLLVESEQLLVTNIAANALTVVRALNGTTGATHALNTAISIIRWPAPVERAVTITVARIYARAPFFEPFYVDVNLDTDVMLLLDAYRAESTRGASPPLAPQTAPPGASP